MALQEELKAQGDFLFRYRSYLPFCILPLFILVIFTSETYLYYDRVYNTPLIVVAVFVGLLGQGIRIAVAGFVPRGYFEDAIQKSKKQVCLIILVYTLYVAIHSI